jgi:inhibitor of cysteine peptidase
MKWTRVPVNRRVVSLLFSIFFVFALGTLFFSSLAIAAPPPVRPTLSEIKLTLKDNARAIELKGAQVLVISLEANPSTGYSWVEETSGKGDDRILEQVGEVKFQAKSKHLGAPALQIVRFAPVKEGRTTLRLEHRRPWDTKREPIGRFSLEVTTVGPFSRQPEPKSTPARAVAAHPPAHAVGSTPSSYNWCDHNGCTPVKDQGYCGSCWAFATVAPLESNIKSHDGVVRDLSEQYLVSCNSDGYSCNGGWWAHDYHKSKIPSGESAAGDVFEADFPYQASNAACNSPHTHHEKIASWAFVGNSSSVASTDSLEQAILAHGPVSVALCAGPGFQGYTGGVFGTNESQCCSPYAVNHAVVLAGWNDSEGTWLLRNSWGSGWGESGYMRIKYGTSNVGYAASYISYGPALTAPSNLTAAPTSATQVNLTWADNNTGESGFKIERSPSGTSGWTEIASVAANVTTYSNTGLNCGTPYYYRVLAYDASGASGYSNTANATTGSCAPPAAPSQLVLSSPSQNEIDLAWKDNSNNETGFKIERSLNGTQWTQIATAAANATKASDNSITCGKKYYYRVRASNAGGDSAYSNTANRLVKCSTYM